MGVAAIPLAIGAAAIQGISAYQQGQAASKAAAYNAQVADNNSKIATQNAEFAGAEGEANAGASAMKTASQIATIKTAQAANGVDVNSGSAVNVRASEAELGEVNALNIRANAARQAYGYATQSQQFTSQKQLDEVQSDQANTGSYLSAAGSFLGGASSAANFASYQNGKGVTA